MTKLPASFRWPAPRFVSYLLWLPFSKCCEHGTTLRAPPPRSWTVAPLRTTAPVWHNYYGVFQLRGELVTVCVTVAASSKWNLCLILFSITRSHALKNKQVLFYIPADCHGAQMCILAIDLIMLFHAVLVYSSFQCLVDHNPSSLCLLLWWILISGAVAT